MNLKWKIRLLIMIAITLGLVWGIATKKIFIIPDAPRETTLQKTQETLDNVLKGYVSGDDPDKKLVMLKAFFEERYPWVALAPKYGVDSFTGLDYARWEVTPHLPRAITPQGLVAIKMQKDRFFGELILATRNAFHAETSDPYIKTTDINSILIISWTIPMAGELEDLVKNDILFSSTESRKLVYTLDFSRLQAFSSQPDILSWSEYASPRPWEPWIPNTGPVAQPKPDIPEQ